MCSSFIYSSFWWMWTMWSYRWWMKKSFCSCRSDLFPSTIRGNDSIHFFCRDISVKHSSLHSQKPLWFLSRYVSLSTALSSNLMSTWNRANLCLFLLSELITFFFYLFLGCLLVVLGSCAILSKSSLFHAANKNEQDPNQHIYRWHNSEKWHAKIPKRKVWEKQR